MQWRRATAATGNASRFPGDAACGIHRGGPVPSFTRTIEPVAIMMKNPKILRSRVLSARLRGFTLIELMIVVAVVAILSAIAVPSYTEYIRRGQVTEAGVFLSDYRIKMEQYYQDNKNYGTVNCVDGASPPSWANFAAAKANNFTFSCALNGTVGYVITATGSAGRAVGHAYTIDQDNTHTTTQFKGGAVNVNCWRFKGSEC